MSIYCKKDKKTGEERFGYIEIMPNESAPKFMHSNENYTEEEIRTMLSQCGKPELDIEGLIADAKKNPL